MLNPIIVASTSIPRKLRWTDMLSCSADQHTTCCIHSSHHDPDTHVPEMDFDVFFFARRLQRISRIPAVQVKET